MIDAILTGLVFTAGIATVLVISLFRISWKIAKEEGRSQFFVKEKIYYEVDE